MALETRYRQAFARLKAPPQLKQEVLSMTEQKRRPKKFIVRRLVVAAAVAALAGALAIGANAATGGELFETISITLAGEGFQQVAAADGTYTYRGQLDGEDIYVTFEEEDASATDDSSAPSATDSTSEVESKQAEAVE